MGLLLLSEVPPAGERERGEEGEGDRQRAKLATVQVVRFLRLIDPPWEVVSNDKRDLKRGSLTNLTLISCLLFFIRGRDPYKTTNSGRDTGEPRS